MVLLPGFPEVPAFCSQIVALYVFWFFAASLGAWEGHICPSFLVFCGTPLKLSQSHFNCAARPEDPKPLASSEDLAQSIPLDSFFLSSDLGGLGPFLSSLCFMSSKACPFMDFGLHVLWACHPFSLWWAQHFLILLSMGLAHCAISLGLGVMIF